MRKIIRLMFLAFLLGSIGCSSNGGGSHPQATNKDTSPSPDSPTPPVPEPPIDYSKVMCSTVPECSATCDVLAPKTDDATIDSDVCGTIPTFQGSACNAIKAMNLELVSLNQLCKQDFVTNIITTDNIGSQPCSSGAGCVLACNTIFSPLTRNQILNANGISGASLKMVFENQIEIESLDACLAAPEHYILNEY